MDDLSFFEYLSPFFFCKFNFIVLFPFLIKYYNILFVILFWLGFDWLSTGTSFFRACFTFFHTHASLLIVFICPIVLLQSCCSHARVFGKTLVHEFPFPIAILNGTSSFLSLVQENINMPSGHYYRLCCWIGLKNHLIKKIKILSACHFTYSPKTGQEPEFQKILNNFI